MKAYGGVDVLFTQYSRFLNNVLPEDGPVWPKHVAHKHGIYKYFNDIFKHFNEYLMN
jgi:hypothetical protein